MSGRRASPGMFARLVLRGLLVRRRRALFALLALAVGATLASALLTTYEDLERKMSGELRGYGANLTIAPPSAGAGATFDHADIQARIQAVATGLEMLPALYVVGRVNEEPAALAGLDFARLGTFSRGWQWRPPGSGHDGHEPLSSGSCIVGERLAEHFRLKRGSRVKLAYGGNEVVMLVAGTVATGASEDHQVLVALEELQRLAGLPGRVSVVQAIAPGNAAELEARRARLAESLAGVADVRLVRPVAEASARVLLKVKWMMFGISGMVLGIVGLCVMTTLTGMVLERRKDIAVMKALGGGQRRITTLFLAETALLAVLGAAAGYLAGTLLAREIGRAVFASPVAWRAAVLPEVALVSMAVALAATLLPLRIVRRVEPAAILKGE